MRLIYHNIRWAHRLRGSESVSAACCLFPAPFYTYIEKKRP